MRPLLKNKYFLTFLFLGINFLVYGYSYGNNSYHDYLLSYIQKLIDPSLYPGDLYLTTLPSFPSAYIYGMAFLGKYAPLEHIHFILCFIIKYLFFLGIYQLAEYLFSNRYSTLLALFLAALSPLFNAFGLAGGEPVTRSLLYQTSLVVPFLLFSIYYFLKKKYIFSFALLAFSYYFSGLLANYVVFIFLVSILISWRDEDKEIKKSFVRAFGLFLLFVLPWLIWPLGKYSSGLSSPEFIALLKNYHAGHSFASSWDIYKWQRIGIYLLLFLFFIRNGTSRDHKSVLSFVKAILILWLTGFIFGEIIPVRLVVVSMLFRSDIFVVLFGILFAADYLQKMIFSRQPQGLMIGYLLILVLSDIHLFLSIKASFLLSVLFFAIVLREKASQRLIKETMDFLIPALIVGTFVFCAYALQAHPLQSKVYLSLTVILAFLLLAQKMKDGFPQKPEAVFLGVLFLSLLAQSDVVQDRLQMKTLNYETPLRISWKQTQLWAEKNTPKETAFLTPPYLNGFRSFSKRPVFVEKIDGGAMHWHPGFERSWSQRLMELGYGPVPLLHFEQFNSSQAQTAATRLTYASLDEGKILMLAKKYRLDFVVEENFHELAFPRVYQNELFSVYRIPAEAK